MNSFSTFGGMLARGQTNVNSMTYINRRYAQGITADFSGSSYIDLSNTYQYAVTSSGLNMTNGINGNTFARLKYNGAYLKTADFSSTGSFTIYLKHAARFNPLPPLNFQYPNVISLSKTVVNSGSSFTANYYFYSLNPVASVIPSIPYSITGCNPADLNGAALTGNFTTISQSTTYSVASGVAGKTITFNVSGGTAVSIYVPSSTYTVTYNFLSSTWGIKDSNGLDVSQPLDLSASKIYAFDQSDPSNADTQGLLFSSSQTSYTPNLDTKTIVNGVPGTANAYTILLTSTTNISVYPYTNIYYVKVVSNARSQSVFSISTSLNGTYYNQPNITFFAGYRYAFYVSDQSVSGYNLVFGNNEIANSSLYSVVGTPGQPGAYVLLDLVQYTTYSSTTYSGSTTIQYFEQTRPRMGYYPFVSMLATPPDNVWYKFEAGDINGSGGVKNYVTNSYTGKTQKVSTATTRNPIHPTNSLVSGNLISGATSLQLARSQYIQFATTFTDGKPSVSTMTMSMWIKTQDLTPSLGLVIPLWQYSLSNGATTIYFEYKTGGIKLFYDTTEVVYTAASGLPDSNWHHICLVVNARSLKMYYDTSLMINVTSTVGNLISIGSSYTSYSNIGIGSWYGAADPYFQGYVDDYRMYTTALSATEVAKLYNYRDEITYDVTINGGVITLNGVSNPTITFRAGTIYIFRQSDASNTNKQIYFSRSVTAGVSVYTDGETIVGTPGQTGAYTKLINATTFTGLLYYFVPL